MMTGFLHLHSTLRWVVLALLVYTIICAVIGKAKNQEDFSKQAKLGLFTMISLHVQFVLGLTLFLGNKDHWGEFVNEGITRFIIMEHLPMMIIAVILGTLGHSLSKRAVESSAKYKKQIIFFGISLFLILAMIPWPFMRGFGEAYGWI